MSNNTALSVIAKNTGATEEDIQSVLTGMIVSAKNQRGAQATSAEMAVITGVCSKYGLNPLVKECAAFLSGGKLSVVVMVDGWYKMVNRQLDFDGVEFEDNINDNGDIISITCKMYVKKRSRPTCVTEYMKECFDAKSSVWKRWPNRMLRHKAYIQAARIAFGISEVIDDDERNRIDSSAANNAPSQPQKAVAQIPPVDFDKVDQQMLECGDLKTLDDLCIEVKATLDKTNQWNESKLMCVELKAKHKARIEALTADIEEAEFEEETAEPIEAEVKTEAEEDVSFE